MCTTKCAQSLSTCRSAVLLFTFRVAESRHVFRVASGGFEAAAPSLSLRRWKLESVWLEYWTQVLGVSLLNRIQLISCMGWGANSQKHDRLISFWQSAIVESHTVHDVTRSITWLLLRQRLLIIVRNLNMKFCCEFHFLKVAVNKISLADKRKVLRSSFETVAFAFFADLS